MLARFSRAAVRPLVRTPRRHAHFVTWPPSLPARPFAPNPSDGTGILRYGWGDWFVASQIASVVAWPAIFLTDVIFGDYLLPAAEAHSGTDGNAYVAIAGASLIPKAAGSYAGVHLYLPQAWWFWKLSLMPALPISMGLSVGYYMATKQGKESEQPEIPPDRPFDVVDWQESSSEFPHVRQASKPSPVANAAFQPSSSDKKSVATRFLEAAPNAVQMLILGVTSE